MKHSGQRHGSGVAVDGRKNDVLFHSDTLGGGARLGGSPCLTPYGRQEWAWRAQFGRLTGKDCAYSVGFYGGKNLALVCSLCISPGRWCRTKMSAPQLIDLSKVQPRQGFVRGPIPGPASTQGFDKKGNCLGGSWTRLFSSRLKSAFEPSLVIDSSQA